MDDQQEITPAGDIGSILFACNINAVRSAMAEAIIKKRFFGQIFTDSCGVAPVRKTGLRLQSWQKSTSISHSTNQRDLMIWIVIILM